MTSYFVRQFHRLDLLINEFESLIMGYQFGGMTLDAFTQGKHKKMKNAKTAIKYSEMKKLGFYKHSSDPFLKKS